VINAPKRNKKNRFLQNLSTRVLQKDFGGVFELPSLRNTQKRDKSQKTQKQLRF
jgi:hypothetical protein